MTPCYLPGMTPTERTPARAVMTPVPNQPKTPMKSFRIPEATYKAAQAKAAEKGETLTDVVRRALARYARSK